MLEDLHEEVRIDYNKMNTDKDRFNETHSPEWLEGYDEGLWCSTFPDSFKPNAERMKNADYKAGFEKGAEDGSKT